jgi:hypothetical protein
MCFRNVRNGWIFLLFLGTACASTDAPQTVRDPRDLCFASLDRRTVDWLDRRAASVAVLHRQGFSKDDCVFLMAPKLTDAIGNNREIPDFEICLGATTPRQGAWSGDPRSGPYRQEAAYRGLTVLACREIAASSLAQRMP